MTARLLDGQRTWSGSRDEKGQRTYKIKFRVQVDSRDGPAIALQCPGLPQVGQWWKVDNDRDDWAQCKHECAITPVTENEPNEYFDLEFTFSTKPDERCQDAKVEDPLLEPQKVSGSFKNYTEEATVDRFGFPVVNSAWEQMRGPQVEFDKNRPTVKIEQNVANLGIELFSPMIDTVNGLPLWGLPPRTIKLSNVSWERKFYGQCNIYFTRTFEFDVRYETFDRDILDEGTKALHGHFDHTTGDYVLDLIGAGTNAQVPNPNNPKHFDHFKDRQGENCKVVLNGHGLPAGVVVTSIGGKTSKYFVSIIASNVGKKLDNATAWLAVNGDNIDLGPPVKLITPQWDTGIQYKPGFIVEVLGLTYVCSSTNIDDQPPSSNWVTTGVTLVGNYDVAHTYNKGEVVLDTAATTQSGSIHVEKYQEANFLLLGIPVNFTTPY